MNDQRSMKVADHYNKIQSLTFGERKMSKIINLRNINNFIKAVLINLYVKQNDTVLDLGCGKGGDLLKYKKRGIKYLYGIDIANESINEFERRIHSQNKPFDVDLSVNDICNEEIDLKKQFDVISLQFSLHYSFETEKTFKTLFNTILRHSKIGTRILITTIDQSSILKMYNEKLVTNKPCGHCKKQSMCVGNSLFHIKLGDITKYKTFGNVYSFFLNEAVDECEEFLLPCGFLVDEFEQNGFELKENKCFGNFLEKYKDKFSYLRKRMVPNEPSKEEKEVIDIYRALVLEKIE
ncbi:mRNA cap methyltransferase [Pseudoloma neurophilia]|uniref:mRNA cap guanine-N(7) methyltransferase n=1 Tax=Pseudoloma neurophilia TaxID=146866 RepID=A0A0R0M585_9MICR|nr:mRNA cap methyltransferase [Pseudoloma neurophilia]